MSEFLNLEYSRELNRFMPLNPWQGGPPHNNSTSPVETKIERQITSQVKSKKDFCSKKWLQTVTG